VYRGINKRGERGKGERADRKRAELLIKELYCILYKLLGRYFHSRKIDLCMETGPPAHNTINFFWVYIEMLPPLS